MNYQPQSPILTFENKDDIPYSPCSEPQQNQPQTSSEYTQLILPGFEELLASNDECESAQS
jgi:hypothetical protein